MARKHLICTAVYLIVFATETFAQMSRSFDIATFTPPTNWKAEDRGDSFVISDIGSKGYCLLVIYASTKSKGKVRSDFDLAWAAYAVGTLGIKGAPKTEPARESEGWTYILGAAQGTNEAGSFAVLITTATGFGKTISTAAILNNEGYMPTVEKFVDSLKLNSSATQGVDERPIGPVDKAIIGSWTTSSVQGGGHMRLRYVFNANGTYTFKSERNYTPQRWWTIEETGSFAIAGNVLTVSPGSSKATMRDLNGVVKETRAIPLEKVSYKWTTHYFSGIDETDLVLEPPQKTSRDGIMGSNSQFPRAYIYSQGDRLEWRF